MGVACSFWRTSSLSSTRKCLQFSHVMKCEANIGEESLAQGHEVSHLWLCYQSVAELAWVLGSGGSHQCSSFSSQLELMDFNFQLEKSGCLYPVVHLGMVAAWQGWGQCCSNAKFGGVLLLWFTIVFLLRGVLCDPWPIWSAFLPTNIFGLYSEMGTILNTGYEYRFKDVVVITVPDKMAYFRKGKAVTNAAFHKRDFN